MRMAKEGFQFTEEEEARIIDHPPGVFSGDRFTQLTYEEMRSYLEDPIPAITDATTPEQREKIYRSISNRYGLGLYGATVFPMFEEEREPYICQKSGEIRSR